MSEKYKDEFTDDLDIISNMVDKLIANNKYLRYHEYINDHSGIEIHNKLSDLTELFGLLIKLKIEEMKRLEKQTQDAYKYIDRFIEFIKNENDKKSNDNFKIHESLKHTTDKKEE